MSPHMREAIRPALFFALALVAAAIFDNGWCAAIGFFGAPFV